MKKIIVLVFAALTAISCTSSRKVTYFQGIDEASIEQKAGEYQVRIAPNDNLHISVNSINPEAANIFNSTNTTSTTNSEALNITGYLVDQDGYINFPLLGRIKVGGMTKMEATEYIQQGISEYIKDPTVNIRFLNFKVTVLGEVVRPGTYSVKDERLTLLEALGMAGDLTIYGKRDNVLVCREKDGMKYYERLDLTSPEIFNSDYYYLQQNDLIYIQPNKARSGSSSYNQNLSIGVSLLSLVVTIVAILL